MSGLPVPKTGIAVTINTVTVKDSPATLVALGCVVLIAAGGIYLWQHPEALLRLKPATSE